MYCPKCKEDIKPGSEKKSMHQTGATAAVGGVLGGTVFLFIGSSPLRAVIIGGILIVGGLIFGFANPQAVCPACKKVLLPETPFDDSEP